MYGPVAVVLNADDGLFKWHKTGVIKSAACGTKTGHAVLAVGYGKDSENEDYVIIKNSIRIKSTKESIQFFWKVQVSFYGRYFRSS
jgi:hypothetical protein